MVLTPLIFAKDHLMRLKKKRLGPTMGLKVARRELTEARVIEAEEGGKNGTSRPFMQKKGKKTSVGGGSSLH